MMTSKEDLQKECDRLHHLTHVLIEHIWKGGGLPLKHIDKKMYEYDKQRDYEDHHPGDARIDYSSLTVDRYGKWHGEDAGENG